MKLKLTYATKVKCSECGADKIEQVERVINPRSLYFTDGGFHEANTGFDRTWEQTLWLKIEPIKEAQ